MNRKVNVRQWLAPMFRIEEYKNEKWEWVQDADDWRSAIRKFNTLSSLNMDSSFRLIEILATTSGCSLNSFCPLKTRMSLKLDDSAYGLMRDIERRY